MCCLDLTFNRSISVYHVPQSRCQCKCMWSTRTRLVIGWIAVLMPFCVATQIVSFAVCRPTFQSRARSSGVAAECRSLVIILLETLLFYSLHLSMSARYAVAMLADATRHLLKSLGLYTHDIWLSCILVSLCGSTCASSIVMALTRRLIVECIAHISIVSRLCFPGLRVSWVGFQSLPVSRAAGYHFLSDRPSDPPDPTAAPTMANGAINVLCTIMNWLHCSTMEEKRARYTPPWKN
jgi:hypothetical protein